MSDSVKLLSDALLESIRQIVRQELAALNGSHSQAAGNGKPHLSRVPSAMLTPEAVAKRLAVSHWSIRRLIRTGELPAIPVLKASGKTTWRVDSARLERWLESRGRSPRVKKPRSADVCNGPEQPERGREL